MPDKDLTEEGKAKKRNNNISKEKRRNWLSIADG